VPSQVSNKLVVVFHRVSPTCGAGDGTTVAPLGTTTPYDPDIFAWPKLVCLTIRLLPLSLIMLFLKDKSSSTNSPVPFALRSKSEF
jgi:hypothetical protein